MSGEPPAPSPVEVLGALAAPERLRALAALVLGPAAGAAGDPQSGPMSTAAVAARAGLAPRQAVQALARLRAARLVAGDGDGWRLDEAALRAAAAAASTAQRQDPDEDPVVGRFLRGGVVVAMPAPGEKRRLVLDRVAALFEPGTRYPEREVDALLRAVCGDGRAVDHAALRRYLVEEGFLERGEGRYWRAGGSFEVV